MNISTELSYSHQTPCVVVLGCFDGVHLGHASVINTAKKKAQALGIPLCLWSFAEPPKRFYDPDNTPLLTDNETKLRLIENLGVDIYLSVNFNKSISSLSPEEFFNNIIVNNLRAAYVVCGFNFTVGKGGTGNNQTLENMCKAHSIDFISVPSTTVFEIPVSSSRIRASLLCGDLDTARLLLGRPYSISSKVVDGKRLGRTLGFPTINQKISPSICLPQNGVYLTKVYFDGLSYDAITNIGTQPTVGGSDIISETHIFDFSDNVYGKEITVEFLKFIRPVKKFSSIEELKSQVQKDIKTAKDLIK